MRSGRAAAGVKAPAAKKILSFILTAFVVASGAQSSAVFAEEIEPVYAYLSSGSAIYSLDSSTDIPSYEMITYLPGTYFVALLSDMETAEGYIEVSYSDITGYMKRSDLEIVDYEPVTKYASGSLSTSFDGQNVNIRSKPDHTDIELIQCSVPSDTGLFYYGTADGTQLIKDLPGTWYYVRYSDGQSDKRGYVHYAQVNAVPISDNVIEKVVKPTPPDGPGTPTVKPSAPQMDNLTTGLFIACLCIPAVLIVFLIFRKPASSKRTPRHYREE